MKYQSKKDETIFAKVVEENEKFKTVTLEYLTGEKVGNQFPITSSTLKRWWRKVNDEGNSSNEEEVSVSEISDDKSTNKNVGEVEGQIISEAGKTVASDVETEPEIFHVEVEDEETGKKTKVDIDPSKIDIDTSKYNFNPSEEEKKITPIPRVIYEYGKAYLCEDYFLADGTPYPKVEEMVDKIVEWGGDVKSYKHCIRLTNKTLIIFKPNKRNPKISRFEIRMPDAVGEHCEKAEYKPMKGAMYHGVDYNLVVYSLDELQAVIKEISNY